MNPQWPARLHGRVIDAVLILISAVDAAVTFNSDEDGALAATSAAAAVAAVVFRRKAPYLAFLATVPALFQADVMVATLVVLYTVAEKRPRRAPLMMCMAIVVVCYLAGNLWSRDYPTGTMLQDFIYATLYAGAPVFLGLLMRTRAELSAKLAEIENARRSQQMLLVGQALARERADLAREMHDVVSHQVSLIAVQAGALQVTAADAATVETARTIRGLSVRTLDELRDMVRVLRVAGNGQAMALQPQPGIENMAELVAGSGIETTITTDDSLHGAPSAAVQRAVYRAVQEGLTNIHKHAPGAEAFLNLRIDGELLDLTLRNTPAKHPTAVFPSDQNGLLGLRERAEILGGSLESHQLADGGFELRMRLPVHA